MGRLATWVLPGLVLLTLVWFLGVHRVQIMENCPSCYYGLWVEEYRLFGITVKSKILDPGTGNAVYRMTRDLGLVCQHSGLFKFTKIRWWGLLIKWPERNGSWLAGGECAWYDPKGPETVRRMVELDPQLPETFRKRVIEDKDAEYRFRTLLDLKRMMGVERSR